MWTKIFLQKDEAYLYNSPEQTEDRTSKISIVIEPNNNKSIYIFGAGGSYLPVEQMAEMLKRLGYQVEPPTERNIPVAEKVEE